VQPRTGVGQSALLNLKRAAIAAEVCAIGWLIHTEDLNWITPTLLASIGCIACAVLTVTAWPAGAIALMVAGSAVPRIVWTMRGLHIHPEHIVVFAALVAVLAKRAYGLSRLNLQTFDYFLFAYVALNFFSSAFTSPDPARTLRWAVLQTVVILPYFLLRLLVQTREMLWNTWVVLLIAGGAGALYGCIAFASNRLFGTAFGVETEQYGTIPGTYGTQYEANIFGSYSACVAIMFLVGFLMSRDKNRKWWWVAGFLIGTLALVISLSRAVLLSFPVAALVVFWMTAKAQHLDTKRVVKIASVAAVVLLLSTPILVPMLRERFETLGNVNALEDDTTVTRLIQMKVAVDSIREHPIFGTGTASFQLFFHWEDYVSGGMGDGGGWLSNTPLRVLNDTGVVGLAAFLGFLVSLVWRFRKVAHYSDHRTRTVMVALMCGTVLYAMTFQATEATILAFTWVHLGLLASGIVILEKESLQPVF
jgi:O-antigen ligase